MTASRDEDAAMTPEEAFLQAVRENPDDDGPRLMFADWLEEHGDIRGEFIHVQIELSRDDLPESRRAALQARERTLLEEHRRRWEQPLAGLVASCVFRRGFIDEVSLDAGAFLERAPLLFARVPIRTARLGRAADLIVELAYSVHLERLTGLALPSGPGALGPTGAWYLADSPHLAGLRSLDLATNALGDEGVALLAGARGLPNLVSLNLRGNLVTDAGAEMLAASPNLPALKILDLSENRIGLGGVETLLGARRFETVNLHGNGTTAAMLAVLTRAGKLTWLATAGREGGVVLDLCRWAVGDEGAVALAASPQLGGVRTLLLRGSQLTAFGLRQFSESPHARGLRTLDVSNNAVADAGVVLAAGGGLTGLRSLGVRYNRIGDAGVAALARSSDFANLDTLDLSSNRVGPRGAAALAASRHLANLATLYLMYNEVGDEGAGALADSPYLRRLTTLDLRFNHVGDAGARRLAASRSLGGLRSLVIWGNDLGPAGRDALRERFGDRVHL
jgi:uncharacterized protein (TIGR02996 family)